MNFNRRLVINYHEVYGTEKVIDQAAMSTIDRLTWARVLARLNHLARTRKNYGIIDVLKDWLGSENQAYANELLHKIINAYKPTNAHPSSLLLINVWTNLNLLDRMLSVQAGEAVLDAASSERELLDIYMAMNGELGEKTSGIFDSVSEANHPDTIDRLARVSLTNLIPYHDINHFKATELLIAGTIKTYYLFSFLETEHIELVNLFLKAYHVESWRDYLKGMLPMAIHGINEGDGSGLNYLSLKESENKEQSRKLLDHLALVDDTLYKIKTDFLNARSNPLFRIDEDTYLVLDAVLAVNRIYNSVFFELLRLAEKNKQLHQAYNDFFSFYTYEFIEKYLSYQLLDKIFGQTSYYRISGADIVARFGIDTEPDYYVRNGHKVFLFEVKGSMIRGDAKQSFHYPTVENELKEKYLFNTEDEENKAIVQLAERIRILFEGGAVYDPNYRSDKIRVYPILIVSELALTTPGTNVVMNQWFQAELEKQEILRNNRSRIADLIIIDLDSLILYAEHFEHQKGLFEDSLNAYYAAIDRKKIRPKHGVPMNEAYAEELMMRTYQPFNGFLHDFIKLQVPALFRQFAVDLIDA
ncbi:MAG: hypothetical protein JWP44_1169 [Mucilaginibacter sp.]|nr:hypothetical protein [Mucilaginibacter sp.]